MIRPTRDRKLKKRLTKKIYREFHRTGVNRWRNQTLSNAVASRILFPFLPDGVSTQAW